MKIAIIAFVTLCGVISIYAMCKAIQYHYRLKKNRDIYDEVKELDNE